MTCPPGDLPNSGANEDVTTRNSCKASTDTRLLVPPTALNACDVPVPDCAASNEGVTPKLAETPSIVKLLESVRWPAMLNCPVATTPVVGAMTTPGVSCNKVLKLRPFNGKFSTN